MKVRVSARELKTLLKKKGIEVKDLVTKSGQLRSFNSICHIGGFFFPICCQPLYTFSSLRSIEIYFGIIAQEVPAAGFQKERSGCSTEGATSRVSLTFTCDNFRVTLTLIHVP